MEIAEETEEQEGGIRIKLVSNRGREVLFQVQASTKLGVVMRSYCQRLRLNSNSVRFLFDGNRINEGLLVSQSGLENGDIVDVQESFEGGGGGGGGHAPLTMWS